ncbi:MAG: DUF5723 family protein [Chitinispirillia bacterium]|nr:DUF5723 family protein [Chitinispirillia bacterium]MCL2268235.1 DUF5723 family protein [Chitinispirillia bacterium]
MKKVVAVFLSILFMAGYAFSVGPDNYAAGAASTQPRTFGAIPFDGAFGNPALVGLGTLPRSGLSFFPTSIGLWSNRDVPPTDSIFPINFFDLRGATDRYMDAFYRNSFGINERLEPRDVYEALTGDKNGVISVYAGLRSSPLAVATRGFALNINTSADIDINVPGAFLLPRFSAAGGFPDGAVFDISGLRAEAIWATEAAVKLGFSTVVPAFRDHLKLDRGAAGLGLKLILGHSYFKAEAAAGSELTYDSASYKFIPRASADVISVGTGYNGDFNDFGAFISETPINGQGWGVDLGSIFHNDRHFISLDVQDLGMIFWNGKQTHKRTVVWDTEFPVTELQQRIDEVLELDSMTLENQSFLTWLPAALNIGYNYHYAIPEESDIAFLIRYFTWSLGYRQQLALGPGRNTYMPRGSASVTLGLLDGALPLRYGVIAGGPEELASVAGVSFDLMHTSLDFYYKVIGSPVFTGKKGFEMAGAMTFRWGWTDHKPKRGKAIAVMEDPEEEPVEEDVPLEEEEPLETIEAVEDIPVEEERVEEIEKVIIAEDKPYVPTVIHMTMLPPPPALTVVERRQISTAQRAINFRSGGAELTPESYEALDAIVQVIKHYPQVRYEIQGHTDAQGGHLPNLHLSARRANAVKQYLISKGAPPVSLIAIGYGKNMPVASNITDEGRAQNRRVEFMQILSQEQYDTLRKLEAEIQRYLGRE